MGYPLPLPKNRVWQIVVADLYVLAIFSTPYCCWMLLQHQRLDWFRIAEFALIIALSSVVTNMDYIGWRDKRQPMISINPDRDEAPPSV